MKLKLKKLFTAAATVASTTFLASIVAISTATADTLSWSLGTQGVLKISYDETKVSNFAESEEGEWESVTVTWDGITYSLELEEGRGGKSWGWGGDWHYGVVWSVGRVWTREDRRVSNAAAWGGEGLWLRGYEATAQGGRVDLINMRILWGGYGN